MGRSLRALPAWLLVVVLTLANPSCKRKGHFERVEVIATMKAVDLEYRYAHDPLCYGDRGCQLESYKGRLYVKKGVWYSDAEVRNVTRAIRTERDYVHDRGCGIDKECQIESYSWHMYYNGRPDFLE